MLIFFNTPAKIHGLCENVLQKSQVDDSPNPLPFTQLFQLVPEGQTYYVYVCVSAVEGSITHLLLSDPRLNDIFRLNLG